MILGREVRECCHGPDRHRAEKIKAAQTRNLGKADHAYSAQGRKLIQTTTKMNCPAAIHVRSILRFPSYKTEHNSEWARRKQSKNLRADLNDESKEVSFQHYMYIALPDTEAHKNHLTEEVGAMTHHADKKVIDKIHCLVAEGVRDVAEMKRHIYSFSKTNFPLVPETSNRFYPSNKCLRNHMYSSLSLSQFSMEDQENLKQNVVKWRNEEPDDNFFFVPSPKDDEGEDFLFVCQTAWQRRLLSIYGNEICLMDATYGICKSEVALYFICVSTNIGYITVGCFILPSETIKNITRGLDVLKQWNPDWTPTFFMTDYDEKEIAAIETSFPGCFTFLCDFHREQSWGRWLTSNTNSQQKKELLHLMREITNADSELMYTDAVESLKESQHWQKNQRLRIWFEKQWLSASKRWVRYHRQSLTNVRVTTTNGLERQHYQLKQHYLKNYTAGTVTSLTTTVVKQFVPDSYKRYVEYNVKCLDSSRRYSEDLPRFLHNRPRLFLDHCTQRLPSAISMPVSNISVLPHQKFTVLSADSNATYLLDLSGSLPSCSCPDWKKNHLPCKHMLCILLKVPGSGWETLSEEFKNSPHLNIDMDLFSSVTRDKKQDGLMDSCCSDSPPTPKATTCQKHKVTVGVGSRCKMLASSLKSMLYLVQTASDYESIYADLMLLHSKVRALVPKESGLLRRPPRLGRKSNTCKHGLLKTRRKYRRTRLKKTTFVKGEKVPDVGCPRIVPQDTTVPVCHEDIVPDQAEPVGKMLPVPASSKGSTRKISFQPTDISVADVSATTSADSSSDMRTIIESKTKQVLREVLENQPTGRLLFQIGPYTITDHSIHFLNSTLSDEVIDVFLHLMPKKNVYHIDSINMTSIFEGDQESTGFLNKIPLHQYDALIGAVNENQVHWVLMIVVPDAKCLVYINPMGEPRSKCDKYRNRWTAFLRERSRRHIGQDALTHDGWEVQTVPHDKQTDGSSCGVYVIRFADLYLSGEEMDRCWTSQDIKKERLRLQLKLLSLGINAEVPLQDPSRLEVKQALDEFSETQDDTESPREGLDMTARMNQTTNDVDLPDLEVPVAPVEWSSLESEQDQESIMEKHQRKGNLRQKRPKDVLSKKGQKRLQKIKEKNETLVQFLLSKEVKAYLLKIMQGKQASNLHTISTGMSQRARRAIKHSGFGPIDDDEQIDRVVEGYIGYIQELKLDTMKHIDYVFDVWVPEAIMMFYKKKGYSKAKAEEMFNKGVTRTKEEMEVIMHREFQSYRKYKSK